MKNNYTLKTMLTVLLLFASFTVLNSQVRIIEVDPSTNSVTMRNYGSQQDITDYWFCVQLSYGRVGLMTVTEGDLDLSNGEEVTVTSSVNLAASSDLGLFNSNSFSSSTAMQDFLQWGGSFDFPSGRENVAVDKGIWEDEQFITTSPPYQYTGDGSQNGVATWSTLSTTDFETTNFSIYPNPAASNITLEFSQDFSNANLEIYNVLGSRMYKTTIDSPVKNIDIANWSSGLYLIKISSEETSQTKRFIKQ